MGSSGAGKTTLLNLLADQIPSTKSSKLEGEVLINDSMRVRDRNFGTYAAYVPQDDYLFGSFTCEKAIEFAAKLRLTLPHDDVLRRVDAIISELNLESCRKTMIGNEMIKGLSGGEKRRTSIAVELVTNPQIIFLDEPTSGLDSFTAKKIVSLLVGFANKGKTVIATIHQPSSEVFQLFPKLLLMMEGYTIYQGKTLDSVNHFRNLGFNIPYFGNPSDFYLKEFFMPYNRTAKDEEKLMVLADSYKKDIEPQLLKQSESIVYPHVSEKELLKSMMKVNWCKEFYLLLYRAVYNLAKNPNIIKFKMIAYTVLALACLSLFWDLKNDFEGIRSKIGGIFFIACCFLYGPVGGTTMAFSMERPVLIKEYSNKTYGLLSYSISKSLVELPFEAICALYFSTIVYFGIGLEHSFEKYVIFSVAYMLQSTVATSIGILIGTIIPSHSTAVVASNAILAPFVIFGGLPVNFDSIYVWIRWFQYVSPMRYTVEACIRNEFEGKNYVFDPISQFSFNTSISTCFIVLACMAIFFRALAVALIKITTKR